MSKVLVLGAGPAAVVASILLRRMGHEVELVGRVRQRSFLEGASPRVAEGLQRAGCIQSLKLMAVCRPRWSAWGEAPRLANGEFVVERAALDRALLQDARDAGVAVLEAHVLLARQVDQGWTVHALDAAGRNLQRQGQFLVEARGRGAPKSQADEYLSMRSVALIRHFTSARCREALTFSEPFENGWCWATCGEDGRCSIQLVLGADAFSGRTGESLERLHERMYRQLAYLPEVLGALVPTGPAHSRGIQPVRRGGIAAATSLRVGDAAYCVDPLSGHGMYEAISGAFAAAPTINTLLSVPASSELAIRFYENRATRTYCQRVRAGGYFYSSIGQWKGAAFWAQATDIAPWPQSIPPAEPGLAKRAVIVGDSIQEREVLITPKHPEGIRFIAGVDLAEVLRAHDPTPRIDELERVLARALIPDEQRRALVAVLKQTTRN